jgi:hypothetical protein
MEGGHVPDWAVAFLQMLAAQREAVEEETASLRQTVNYKIAEFRDTRTEREAQYQRELQQEAVRGEDRSSLDFFGCEISPLHVFI